MKVTLHEGHYWRLKYLTQKLQNLQFAMQQAEVEFMEVRQERRKWMERAGLSHDKTYNLDDDDLSAECEDDAPPATDNPPDTGPQITTGGE